MKKHLSTRLLSLLLIVAMLAGYAVPAQAVHDHDQAAVESESLAFTKLENSSSLELLNEAADTEEEPLYADTEVVRVSIVLEKESTIDSGFSTENIAANTEAMAYRDSLKAEQDVMTATIETAIGAELNVVHNLTLVANVISANVEYGQIAEIEAVPGVKEVFLETRYEPAVVDQEETVDPLMATSGSQIGSNVAWANGYTGAGSRIAVIDTGIDSDHQSMDAAAFEYALAQNAAAEGMDYDAYVESLDLLDAEEIASVLDQLHVGAAYTAENLYVNSKIAFGYNYIDEDTDIVHDNDSQGSHGSHVSGIATANTYIPNGDGTYAKAIDTVFVQGVAPDAQLITMKVFGKGGGAYDTDYMVAIEDAIILGCDAVNLSLGSAAHGFVTASSYQEVLDALAESGTVALMSAGNNGAWAEDTKSPAGLPYGDDINFYTGGSPASYTNALAVASVQNAGQTGYYVQVGDSKIYYNAYTKDEWTNEPMTSIAGTHEYVFIDGLGTPEDWAAVGDALVGKIALCSRGTIAFYQKGINAVEAGAIATIIYNNAAGTINMDLTDYTKTAPCVSITQEEGALIKSLSTPVTDDEGNVLYYTGTMYVDSKVGTAAGTDSYYTMSTFSSWGVPSALILKPEITTPGGNIYSLNGLDTSGTAYENNSGTSMAAPQATGMTAVVAEFIRENGLEAKTGLTVRQLAQSLLMSTAVPMKEKASGGNYYSVLNQGSGLANVGAAVTAGSYILMNADATASYADGKVKAELGDDPDRTGAYSFSFTLNNFSDGEKSYTLSADIFTQALAEADGISYLDTWTTPIAAKVTYLVNGEEFVPASKAVCDLDSDGDTDADDAQIILNYAVGQLASIDAIADVNGDNAINTYDAYLILSSMNTSAFAVAAGGKADITVNITLSDTVKASLDAAYVNGAYIEGYVFVESTSTTEGVVDDVTHSIPVLGFYGNWSDASMYEKNTYAERLYGDTTPTYFDPGAQYSGMEDINSLIVKFADDTNSYYMTGNPYFTEDTYPADRIAVSGTTTLKNYKVTLIRNAAALAAYVVNEEGDVVYVSTPSTNVNGAYYYTSGAVWRNTSATVGINKAVEKLGVSEGEHITVGVVAIPEYYAKNGALTAEDIEVLIEDGVLGEGAYLTTTMVVDNTAPVVSDISMSLINNKLTITAQDENYLAAVQVTNLTGNTVYASTNPEQTEKGEEVSVVVDLTGKNVSKKYLVTVADYAGNRATYEVSSVAEEVDYTGQMFAYTRNSNRRTQEEKDTGVSSIRWLKIDPDTLWYNTADNSFTGTETFAAVDYSDDILNTSSLNNYLLLAADYVEGFVIFALRDGNIYSSPLDDMDTVTYMGNWSEAVTAQGGETIHNLRLNYADGYVYLLDDEQNFYRFDLKTCEMEYAFTVTLTNPNTTSASYNRTHDFAIHSDGTFYVLNKGYTAKYFYLYKFTLDDVQTVENEDGTTFTGIQDLAPIFNDKDSYLTIAGGYNPYQMFWDHDNEILYMARNYATNVSAAKQSILYTIDVNTGAMEVVNDYVPEGVEGGTSGMLYNYIYGTFVVPSGDSLLLPSNQATTVEVFAPRTEVLVNASMQFSADVGPWNLADKSVTWSSSDETIATIDAKGVATFKAVGNVTITATSVAKPHVQGTYDVSVITYPTATLSAAVTGTDGVTHVAEFSTDDLSTITNITEATPNFLAGGLHEGKVYYHDGAQMYAVDAETQEITNLGVLASSWQWTDAASAPHYGPEEAYLFDLLIGFSSGGMYIELITPEDGTLRYFDLSSNESFSADPFATLCYVGPYADTRYPGYTYYVVRESGKIAKLSIYTENEGAGFAASVSTAKYTYDTGIDMTGVSSIDSGSYGSSFYDEATGYVLLTQTLAGERTNLYAIDPDNGVSALIGTFPEEIKLVNGLYMWDRATDTTVRLDTDEVNLYMDETYELEATVLPVGTDETVTFTSSDEAVATVTDTGVVTPISEGTTTVTATTEALTAEGVPATDTVTVNAKALKEMSVTFNAQVTDADGSIYWGQIDTSDMSVTKISDAPTPITSGGWHDGKIYGTDGDYTSGGYIYEIDPANGYTGTQGAKYSSSYVYVDGASAPTLVTDGVYSGYNNDLYETCDFSVGLSNSGVVLLISDYTSSSLMGFNLSTQMRGATAIALAGETVYEWSIYAYLGYEYYILENDGDLHRMILYPTCKNGTVSYSQKFTKSIANIGEELTDKGEASMLFVDDGVNKGLLIAYSGNANSELYFVDLTSEYTDDETDTIVTYKVGTLAGVTDLAAIHVPAVEEEEESFDPAGKMFTWTSNTTARFTAREKINGLKDRWMVVDPDTLWLDTETLEYTGTTNYQRTTYNNKSGYVLAAEYVDGNVIFAHNDGYLYTAPIGDLNNATQLLYWKDSMKSLNDMALNYQDGYLYILANDGIFFRYNVSTNTLTADYSVSVVCPNSTSGSYLYPTTFAINDDGVFYAVNYGGGAAKYHYLYTWTLSDVVETTIGGNTTRIIDDLQPINTSKDDGYTGMIVKATAHMAWDHDNDVLYIMGNSKSTSTGNSGQHVDAILYTLETATGKASACTDYVPEGYEASETGVSGLMYNYTRGLFIVPGTDMELPVPTDPPVSGDETANIAGKILGWNNNAARQSLAEKAVGVATRWMTIDPTTVWYDTATGNHAGTDTYQIANYSNYKVSAAVFVDGTVYFSCEDGYLYSAPVGDLTAKTQLLAWTDVFYTRMNKSDYYVTDMAYNAKDGNIYLLAYTGETNGIYKYDIAANTLTLDYTISITNPASTKTTTDYLAFRGMTIDDDGNFYAVSNSRMGSNFKFLYKWTLNDVVETTAEDGTVTRAITDLAPVNNTEDGGVDAGTTTLGTQLVWDSDNDVLYMFGGGSAWANTAESRIYLYTIDTATGKGTVCNTYFPEGMTDVGASGQIYNYIRGAFYVPASYTAPVPETGDDAVVETNAPAAEVLEITTTGDAAGTFDVSAELNGFVAGTETTVSSVISLATDIRDLTVRSVGSTNAVAVETAAMDRSGFTVNETGSTIDGNGVELKLTETADVTNGKIVVTYDPAQLTYASAVTAIASNAVYVDEVNGTVTFAYASASEIKAGETLLTVTFTYAGDYVNTTVKTETVERNEETVSETVTTEVTYEVGGHNYEVTDSKDVTCTEDGYITYTCSKCGDSYTEEVKAEGHKYEATVTEPTCTAMGYTTYVCSVCGDSYVDSYVDAKGHSYETVVTEPTCTEMGYTTHTCANCGDSYVDSYVNPTGHDYVTEVTAPTCTAYGYTTYTCAACGESYVSDYVAPTGHSFGDWETVTEPGCDSEGQQKRTCECGEVEYRETEATGHSYTAAVTQPTCTEMGYTTYTCGNCGHSYKTEYVNPTGHSYASVVTAPTCTEMGYTTYTCVCGESYKSDYVLPTGHSHEAVVTAPTCTEMGYTTYTCHCGDSYVSDYVDALGHSFGEWTVTQQETCTEDGVETRICAVCGEAEHRAIAAYCPSESYTDLEADAWYHEGVCYVLRSGLMKGQSEGIFAPAAELNRAELVTVLYRMAGSPSVEGLENPFTDVPAGDWYADAVIWAANNGIVNGVSATCFAPGNAISREQIATILYRYAKAEPVAEDYLSTFTDAASVSGYAVDAMNWAVANGLINGMGGNMLAPAGTANRAQIATILMRFCQKLA